MSLDEILQVFIDRVAPAELDTDKLQRRQVIIELDRLAAEWVSSQGAQLPRPCLLTFGSSILDVVTRDSDVDAVLLLPSSINRDTFFDGFSKYLQSNCPLLLESLMPIPDAHVPVLKMVVNQLPVDILPSRIKTNELSVLTGSMNGSLPATGSISLSGISFDELDLPSKLALNGVRVGRTIVNSIRSGRIISVDEVVSDGEDRMARFKTCLRLIKHWAKSRGK